MTKLKISHILIISTLLFGGITGIILINEYGSSNLTNNRIISIAAACTEIIYSIGCEDRLVGVDQYSLNYGAAGSLAFQDAPGGLDNYPGDITSKTNVGTTSALNMELVAFLNPSIVFSWEWASTANNALANLGYNVIKINPQSIADVLDLITFIGGELEKSIEASAVNQEIQDRINNIISTLVNITEEEKPLIYYELSSLGKTVGNRTITNEMINVAGAINLAGNESLRYPTLSSEYIVARNPDIIIVVDYGETVADIKDRAGWGNITAVQNDAVYQIESGWVTASPRLVLGLEQFLEWFHPP